MNVMARVKDGHLVPLEEAEQIQQEDEWTKTMKACQELIERLEMANRPDLAREVLTIGGRFAAQIR